MECKICTRPFTVFRWSVDRTVRNKKTNICLTCARLKNCCQCCMLDLSFGLPIAIRDAALKLVAQGPQSDINKQYYAQNHEGELKDGDIPEEYEKTEGAARDLLKRLANSEPYYKRRRGEEDDGDDAGGEQKRIAAAPSGSGSSRGRGGSDRGRGGGRGGRGNGRVAHRWEPKSSRPERGWTRERPLRRPENPDSGTTSEAWSWCLTCARALVADSVVFFICCCCLLQMMMSALSAGPPVPFVSHIIVPPSVPVARCLAAGAVSVRGRAL